MIAPWCCSGQEDNEHVSSSGMERKPQNRGNVVDFIMRTHTKLHTPHQHLAQEMKDRESKRWLLEEFVKENEIRAVELEMAYKRFRNLAPSSGSGGKQATSSVEMDFNTWILVSLSCGRGPMRAQRGTDEI